MFLGQVDLHDLGAVTRTFERQDFIARSGESLVGIADTREDTPFAGWTGLLDSIELFQEVGFGLGDLFQIGVVPGQQGHKLDSGSGLSPDTAFAADGRGGLGPC
jgi:hypothetical protein